MPAQGIKQAPRVSKHVADLQLVASALWNEVERSGERISTGVRAALNEHEERIKFLAAPDSLQALIPACLPDAFVGAAMAHIRMVLEMEFQRRAEVAEALATLVDKAWVPDALPVDPLYSTLLVPFQALRGEFEGALRPVKALQDFVGSPTQGQVKARLATGGAFLAFGGLAGLAVAVLGGIVANHGRKSKLAMFAEQIEGGALGIAAKWKQMHREHEQQSRLVADYLFFRSLEPLAMAAIQSSGAASAVFMVEEA
jgi:hypothetical protein